MGSRHLMLVAGSGRSGTSLFAGIVDKLAFHVPGPRVMTDESNPRGFAESQWVVDRHTDYLRRANVQATDARPSAWADTARICFNEAVIDEVRGWLRGQFDHQDRIVIKDPRLLWFLPLWRRVGEELGARVHVVTMLRPPAEVVSSKMNWYSNMPLLDANRAAGWVNTMLFTERATRDHGRAFVRYEDLLDDWTQPVARVSAQFDIPTLVDSRARNQAAAAELIDRKLHRSKATWEDLDVPRELVRLADEVWDDLLLLAENDADEARTRMDGHREEYVSFYNHAEQVAQSTTLAATRKAPRQTPPKAPAGPEASSLANFLVGQVRQRVPASLRDAIPLRAKLALVKLFSR